MSLFLLEIIGFIFYTGLFLHTWWRLSKSAPVAKHASGLLLICLVLHGYISYLNIDTEYGQDFGLFNIFTMTTWLTMIVVYWNLVRHQAFALLIISLPIAALSLLEVAIFEGVAPIALSGKGFDILHILLGISAMSILMLAALQSLLVLYINKGLRNHPANIHSWLGPLQGMERYLIQLLSVGFALLTLALSFSVFLPAEAKMEQGLHKIILTVLSWIVLFVLLFGHYQKGWRGVFAAKWTLVSVFLLLLGYFGSKLVLEFILQS